ncbi:MAG: hypothetical protein ACRETA_01825 [Gammaproteobacteria bacterium]
MKFAVIRRWPLLITVLLLLVATLLAYWPGLHGPFLFDDYSSITNNPALHLGGLARHDLMRAAFSSHAGLLLRPISMMSFAMNYYFFGESSFSFKLVNLFIHLANALLILWLSRRLLVNCRRRFQFEWTDTQLTWASVIVTAVWALHPLNLTSVLYVVQRMTSLAALFTLTGMLAYIYGRERMVAEKTGWPLVWLLTPLCGVIGVLCKEDAALLPLYLLVIEWLIFGFQSANQRVAKNVWAFYFCGLLLPGLIGVAYLIHHHEILAGYAGRSFTLPERVLTEFRVVFLYIKWTFFPDIRQLALYHDDIRVSTGLLAPMTTLWSLLALVALLALAVWQRKQRPLLSLGILWFFAGQMMESTVLPLLIAFEHRNYLPDYGLLLAFFSLLLLPAASGSHVLRPSLRWALAALILPVLFSATFIRASEWRSYLDFAYYEALHHPESGQALYSLGQAYSNLALAGDLKNPEQALQALSRAAAHSTNIMPDVAMMIVSAKLNRPGNPEWEQHARELLLAKPLGVEDMNSLKALVSCMPTKCQALKSTTLSLIQTAFISANRYVPNADLWIVYGNYLTYTSHPLNEIVAAMQQAADLAPSIPQYHINLAKGLTMEGEFDAAESQIQQLSRLNKFGSLDSEIQQLKANLAAGRAETAKGHL